MPSVHDVARTDAGLASELRLSVMRLRRRLAVERQPENPLSLSQMTVLGTLHRHGEMAIGDLAAHERVQPPSMTRTVACLEEGGYLARRPDPNDGRAVLVSLTERGHGTLLADRQRRDAWLARRLTDLTPEERDVLRRAAPLLDRLASED